MVEKSDCSLPISNPFGSDTEISHTVTEQDKLELMLIIYYLYQQIHTHTHTHTHTHIYIYIYIYIYIKILPTSTPDAPKQDFRFVYATTTTFYQQHRFYHKRPTVLLNFNNFNVL